MKIILALISFLIISGAFNGMFNAVVVLLNTNTVLLHLLGGLGLSAILYYTVKRNNNFGRIINYTVCSDHNINLKKGEVE